MFQLLSRQFVFLLTDTTWRRQHAGEVRVRQRIIHLPNNTLHITIRPHRTMRREEKGNKERLQQMHWTAILHTHIRRCKHQQQRKATAITDRDLPNPTPHSDFVLNPLCRLQTIWILFTFICAIRCISAGICIDIKFCMHDCARSALQDGIGFTSTWSAFDRIPPEQPLLQNKICVLPLERIHREIVQER